MLRSLVFVRHACRGPFVPHAAAYRSAMVSYRGFGTTSSLLAKAKKVKNSKVKNTKAKEEDAEKAEDAPEIDFDDSKRKMNEVLEKFAKLANEAKLGRTSPLIFDHLSVDTEFGPQPFTSVAQTSIKGRNFLITVFDSANAQSIINAVLGSNLNMNPQIDPSNKLALKVPLPPLTVESKKDSAKQLKGVYEKFKNGSGKHTLASIRAEVRSKFTKKKKKLSDDEEKMLKEFEKLHKEYVDKLSDTFKSAELVILK